MTINADDIKPGDRVTVYRSALAWNTISGWPAGSYRTGTVVLGGYGDFASVDFGPGAGGRWSISNHLIVAHEPSKRNQTARGADYVNPYGEDLSWMIAGRREDRIPPESDVSEPWRDAVVVRDRDDDTWARDGSHWISLDIEADSPRQSSRIPPEVLDNAWGPLSVVIDADGNNVEAWDECASESVATAEREQGLLQDWHREKARAEKAERERNEHQKEKEEWKFVTGCDTSNQYRNSDLIKSVQKQQAYSEMVKDRDEWKARTGRVEQDRSAFSRQLDRVEREREDLRRRVEDAEENAAIADREREKAERIFTEARARIDRIFTILDGDDD